MDNTFTTPEEQLAKPTASNELMSQDARSSMQDYSQIKANMTAATNSATDALPSVTLVDPSQEQNSHTEHGNQHGETHDHGYGGGSIGDPAGHRPPVYPHGNLIDPRTHSGHGQAGKHGPITG